MNAISLLLCIIAASASAFTLAPVAPQRAVTATRTPEVSMMAAKKPLKKVAKKAAPVKKQAPKKATKKATPAPAKSAGLFSEWSVVKQIFAMELVGGAQGNVKIPGGKEPMFGGVGFIEF